MSGAGFSRPSPPRASAPRRQRRATCRRWQLSLQAELAFDYFELRSADAQRRLLDAAVAAFSEALQLTTNRFEGGAASQSDVAQAKTQLEATRVQATDVARAARAVRTCDRGAARAAAVGTEPRVAPLDMTPPAIPAGLPSQLLERRPDIASAERRVGRSQRTGRHRARRHSFRR